MIVSHRHKFIFMKTKKTAGTSIELALRTICGPNDIIAPVVEDRQVQNLAGGPRNWVVSPAKRFTPTNLFRRLRGKPPVGVGFSPHITAKDARAFLDDDVWTSYFKFTVERNPWDRQVSHYHYHVRPATKRTMTFDQFMKTKRAIMNNYEIYSLDGKIVADFVMRYEALADDFAEVVKLIGINEPISLPNAKSGIRKGGKDYKSYYTDDSRNLIANWYAREIEAFSYEF